jgi:hypothetical protein
MATAATGTTAGAAKRTRPQAAPDPEPPPATDGTRQEAPHICTVGFCPICLAVTALQPLKPEVVEHLLNAGREFLLAVKAVVDARAEDVTDDDDRERRLERIDIA